MQDIVDMGDMVVSIEKPFSVVEWFGQWESFSKVKLFEENRGEIMPYAISENWENTTKYFNLEKGKTYLMFVLTYKNGKKFQTITHIIAH